jgi:hypothetical protein
MASNVSKPGELQTVSGEVRLPAPTSFPLVFAFGIALLFAGLVTSASLSVLGAVLFVVGAVGWFCDIFPYEKHVEVTFHEEIAAPATSRARVERIAVAPDVPRALLPLEIYPVSAGVKGGLAGSVAMALLACLYGLLKQGSIWYPINLLAATGYRQQMMLNQSSLKAFHLESFLIACVIHVLTSLLVGLLYGAMLPMFPRRPIFLGGVLAPVLWTGLLHAMMDLINPLLASKVDWWWFAASQFAFGIVAGLVVVRQQRIPVKQVMPFSMRAGIESLGTRGQRKSEDHR